MTNQHRHGEIVVISAPKPICRLPNGECKNIETLRIAIKRDLQDDVILEPISWEIAEAFHKYELRAALRAFRPQPIPMCQP